jgi:CHAT domain-containing protein/tetratricopeptide (TPR) repeat protein
MIQPLFPRPGRHRYRSWIIYSSLMLFINLSPIQIQASSFTLYSGREVRPYAVVIGAVQEDQPARQLEPGKPIERELAGDQSHSYQLTLDAGKYVNLVVDQRGIDVLVQLWSPDSKLIAEFNSEGRNEGKETVELVAEKAGSYRLNVQPRQKGLASGRYEIRIEEVRDATDSDRTLEEARRLHTEYRRLYYARMRNEALPLLERALELREKVLGPEHPSVAAILHNLATLYRGRDNEKAESLHHRARTIWEKAYGPEDPRVAASLNNLAILYDYIGNYAKAEQCHKRALAIKEKTQGPEHRDVADCLHNLGDHYHERGEYANAEPLYQRALVIREKALGPEAPDVAAVLDNLATLNRDRGDYVKAESLAQRVLAIREKVLGPEHSDVAAALFELANINRDRGDYAKAEMFYQRAQTIWEKTQVLSSSLGALFLNDRAILYRKMGDYAQAEQLHKRAQAILEKVRGPQHPVVAQILDDLATLYCEMGEHTKAEPLLQNALAIHEKARGHQHLLVAESLNNLALLYAAKGDVAQAISFQSSANDIVESNLELNLASGSERQKIGYLALIAKQTHFTLSLHSQAAPNDQEALNLAFTTLLRRKGRGLDAMTDTIARLRRRVTPQDQAIFNKLADARSQLAALTFKDPGNDPEDYRARLRPLEEKVEELEAELSARSAEFHTRLQPVTLSAIQAALPTGYALIEFAVFTPYDPRTKNILPPRYLVYLLAPQGQPKWMDLGEAAPIDRAVDAWRESLRNPNRPDVKRLARALDDKVMRPVRALLRQTPLPTRRLLIAPDGSLNLIPFAALVDERYRYLIERYSISYLTSGRELLRLKTTQPSMNAPLVVADPTFDSDATVAMQGGRNSGKSQGDNQGRIQIDPTEVSFPALPGTRAEAEAIKDALPEASLLLQEQATETALKQARAPSILHIATHGFFLSDQEAPPADRQGIPGDDPRRISDVRLSKWSAYIKDPLLRSGLALAGANRGQSGDDDGLLTAMEMAGMDLWGTRLVVLSACDTGVGEVKNGEGVQGMRRALVRAGSDSQIMSLWSVLDKGTKNLMSPYYKALRQGKGRSEGLRQVQLQMLRSKYRRHPFYWAAFILSGEWRNLSGQEEEIKRQKVKIRR